MFLVLPSFRDNLCHLLMVGGLAETPPISVVIKPYNGIYMLSYVSDIVVLCLNLHLFEFTRTIQHVG